MTDLSPAAAAVLDAYETSYTESGLVAALRAAANQVFPLTKTPWGSTLIPILTAQESRARLLAIAAELENC